MLTNSSQTALTERIAQRTQRETYLGQIIELYLQSGFKHVTPEK